MERYFKRAISASKAEITRQKAALAKAEKARQDELKAMRPYVTVLGLTNLERADVDGCKFELIKKRGFNDEAIRRLQEWTPSMKNGYFLYGGVGSGKTQLLKTLMVYWAQKKKTGLFYTLQGLMNEFRFHLSEIEDFKSKLILSDLLMIDDFGAEKTTEFVQVELLSFIDKRISKGKTMFMSSNLHPKQLQATYDLRILDRLQELMVFTECDGSSYRRLINKEFSR